MTSVIERLNENRPDLARVVQNEILEHLETSSSSSSRRTRAGRSLDPKRLVALRELLKDILKRQKDHKDDLAKARDSRRRRARWPRRRRS